MEHKHKENQRQHCNRQAQHNQPPAQHDMARCPALKIDQYLHQNPGPSLKTFFLVVSRVGSLGGEAVGVGQRAKGIHSKVNSGVHVLGSEATPFGGKLLVDEFLQDIDLVSTYWQSCLRGVQRCGGTGRNVHV